jgi:hypothetical protein
MIVMSLTKSTAELEELKRGTVVHRTDPSSGVRDLQQQVEYPTSEVLFVNSLISSYF